MSRRLVYVETAAQNIEGIYAFIAADNPSRADSYVEELRSACRSLLSFTERGRARPELGAGIRSLAYRNQTIFYEIQADVVRIVRILSAGRDVDAEFDNH